MAIPEWVHLNRVSGDGDKNITITTDPNLGAERSYTLTVSGDTVVKNVTITQEAHPAANPLTFRITSDGYINWKRSSGGVNTAIKYSKNGGDWTTIRSSTAGTKLNVVAGDIVSFKGDNAYYNNNGTMYGTFSGTTAGFTLEGNIMSLINSTWYGTTYDFTANYALADLFTNCNRLTDASNLILPATGLTMGCYRYMFSTSSRLVNPPEVLPATTLQSNCYYGMFEWCTGLVKTPDLPATTLAAYCYSHMFSYCYSLTTAPSILPALVVPQDCYASMFSGCDIERAPDLPATALTMNCYDNMFNGCSRLNYIKCLAASPGTNGNYSRENWVRGVASTGTFVRRSGATWRRGDSQVPTGWTIVNDEPQQRTMAKLQSAKKPKQTTITTENWIIAHNG